jgi:hypothetical protein
MRILDLSHYPFFRQSRFGFYQLVYIRPTQICPARCRHCSARAKPGAGSTASLEMLAGWVPAVVSIPGIKWVGLEGGEPFCVLQQLNLILELAHKNGISTSVVTNAYWATDELKATRILQSLPRINFLVISADEFHEEYIPLQRVIAAYKAAKSQVDYLAVQTCVGPDYPQFMARFQEQAGEELWESIDIIESPLAFIGRARESGIMERPLPVSELPDGSCLFLGTPVLRENGEFIACCQQEVVLSSHPTIFHMGNLDASGAERFKSYVSSDVYFQTLRVFGPKAIAEAALKFNWGWRPRRYQRDNLCELCMDLSGNKQVVDGFRDTFNTPEYRKKLALGRSLIFAEQLSTILQEVVK